MGGVCGGGGVGQGGGVFGVFSDIDLLCGIIDTTVKIIPVTARYGKSFGCQYVNIRGIPAHFYLAFSQLCCIMGSGLVATLCPVSPVS